MEEINLKDFFNYYKKYLVIVGMVVFLSILVMFIYDKVFKKPVYSTYTTVLLVKNENDGNDTINQSDITLNQKLVSTYREIIKSRLVLEQVINELHLTYSVGEMSRKISVQSLADTEILKITVTDRDAKLAAHIANSLSEVFNREITRIYKLSNVSVIDKATVPINPANSHLVRDLVLAMFVSFVGVSAIIFVVFYFDDTLRSVDEIENEIAMPVVAKVYHDTNGIDLLVDKKPNAAASESIRTLRTNLQFSAIDSELKSILITSSVPCEGKSFVSANLAVAFAQTGKKVLLIDCDLRKGRQHKIFGISGKNGLSNLLLEDIKNCSEYIFPTKIANLSIMPRGTFPPNPSELLNSRKNASLIKLLSKFYDVLILDGAPIVGLSDSLILSSLVDKTLLVSAMGHTPKTELKNSIKSLQNINANIAGIIANNVTVTRSGYGGYYYYGDKNSD